MDHFRIALQFPLTTWSRGLVRENTANVWKLGTKPRLQVIVRGNWSVIGKWSIHTHCIHTVQQQAKVRRARYWLGGRRGGGCIVTNNDIVHFYKNMRLKNTKNLRTSWGWNYQIIVGLRFSILRYFHSQLFHSQIFSFSHFHSQIFYS